MDENKIEDVSVEAPVKTRRRCPWGSIGILFSAFAFIVLISVFYFAFHRLLIVNTHLVTMTADLNNKLAQDQNDIATLQKTLNDSQQNLQQWHDDLTGQQQAINELRASQKINKADLAFAQAQYLVKLANDNLLAETNLPVVIKLLQAADQDVRDASDTKYLPIRKALASDIAALQAVAQPDIQGIYLQLAALNEQVDKLPLPNNRPGDISASDNATPAKKWWRRGWQHTLDVLRQVVVVRYNKPGERPFIPPDQQGFIYQNLHAQLQQAMLAVVQRQPGIFQASLQQTSAWIKQYFLPDAAVTLAVLKDLEQLQSVVIKPDMPTIAATLQAFAASDTATSATDTTTTPATAQ